MNAKALKQTRHGIGAIKVGRSPVAGSKTCACCGDRLETLALRPRRWICPGCGASHERDLNAAINLKNVAVSSTASARGGKGVGPVREHATKPVPRSGSPTAKAAFDKDG